MVSRRVNFWEVGRSVRLTRKRLPLCSLGGGTSPVPLVERWRHLGDVSPRVRARNYQALRSGAEPSREDETRCVRLVGFSRAAPVGAGTTATMVALQRHSSTAPPRAGVTGFLSRSVARDDDHDHDAPVASTKTRAKARARSPRRLGSTVICWGSLPPSKTESGCDPRPVTTEIR